MFDGRGRSCSALKCRASEVVIIVWSLSLDLLVSMWTAANQLASELRQGAISSVVGRSANQFNLSFPSSTHILGPGLYLLTVRHKQKHTVWS
jgi:hypothetical protein